MQNNWSWCYKCYIFWNDCKRIEKNNPNLEGNIRDYTDILRLIVLSNLEVLNASMIDNNINQGERLWKIKYTAWKELSMLTNDKNIIGIQKFEETNVDRLIGSK